MRGERVQLDAMEAALGTEKDQVGSYEHDGLFVWRLPTLAHEGWEQELLARIPRAKRAVREGHNPQQFSPGDRRRENVEGPPDGQKLRA